MINILIICYIIGIFPAYVTACYLNRTSSANDTFSICMASVFWPIVAPSMVIIWLWFCLDNMTIRLQYYFWQREDEPTRNLLDNSRRLRLEDRDDVELF